MPQQIKRHALIKEKFSLHFLSTLPKNIVIKNIMVKALKLNIN